MKEPNVNGRESKKEVFKKESNNYLSYIGVHIPEKAKQAIKTPIERFYEVNLGP